MPYNEKSKQYVYEYKANKIKRVPLDMQLSDYEELKQAAEAAGLSVNGFIKAAIKAAIAAGTRGGLAAAGAAGSVSSANSNKKDLP